MQNTPHKNRRRVSRLVYAITFAILLGLIALGWGTYRVVAFLEELPNRIVIEIDGESVGEVMNASIESILEDGEDEQQIAVLQQIGAGPIEQSEYRTWIDSQFGESIEQLVGHPNIEVAGEAARLQAVIGSTPR